MEARAGRLLSEAPRPTRTHYALLGLTWAGWTFDFYDLMLLAFVMVPIGQDLHLSLHELSLIFGVTLLATGPTENV